MQVNSWQQAQRKGGQFITDDLFPAVQLYFKIRCIHQALYGCSMEELCPAPGQETNFGSAQVFGELIFGVKNWPDPNKECPQLNTGSKISFNCTHQPVPALSPSACHHHQLQGETEKTQSLSKSCLGHDFSLDEGCPSEEMLGTHSAFI